MTVMTIGQIRIIWQPNIEVVHCIRLGELLIAYTHLSMIAFVILGLSMVRLMIAFSSLLSKNHNEDPDDDVIFYWPHTAISIITFFTIILFWWTSFPLRDLTYFPNSGWNLFTFLLYLSVPFLFFMVSEIVVPQPTEFENLELNLQDYYYKHHKVILGMAVALQVGLLANLFVFFQGEVASLKVVGRVVMLCIMTPMIWSSNKRLHEIGMTIFFLGFIYTIIKYHIYPVVI